LLQEPFGPRNLLAPGTFLWEPFRLFAGTMLTGTFWSWELFGRNFLVLGAFVAGTFSPGTFLPRTSVGLSKIIVIDYR
jgi:hypothetical protein